MIDRQTDRQQKINTQLYFISISSCSASVCRSSMAAEEVKEEERSRCCPCYTQTHGSSLQQLRDQFQLTQAEKRRRRRRRRRKRREPTEPGMQEEEDAPSVLIRLLLVEHVPLVGE